MPRYRGSMKRILFVTLILFGCGKPQSRIETQCEGDFCYQVIDGVAVMEGDIILPKNERSGFSVHPSLTWARWPKGVVFYSLSPNLPNPSRVTEAMKHIEQSVRVRFIPRTNQTAYVSIERWTGGYCWAHIGYQAKKQTMMLDDLCDKRSVIHELGHTLGMWHEHTRPDRNRYVQIQLGNVMKGLESNFNILKSGVRTLGTYDFQSVMHYRPYELSGNGKPTVTKKDGTIVGLSNNVGLSAGDIQSLSTIYP